MISFAYTEKQGVTRLYDPEPTQGKRGSEGRPTWEDKRYKYEVWRRGSTVTLVHAALRLTTHLQWEAGLGALLIGP